MARRSHTLVRRHYAVLTVVSNWYPPLSGSFLRITHPSAARSENPARLACVRPAASVQSEPGSNSQVVSLHNPAQHSHVKYQTAQNSGSRLPALVKRNGYEGHTSNRLVFKLRLRARSSQNADAVAHMSLHLNQQCQRTGNLP